MWSRILFVLATLPLYGQAVRFELVKDQSNIVLRTDKAGLFSAFGHKHGILATEFNASVCADPSALEHASVSVQVATAGLRVDTPEARRLAGLSDSGPSADDVHTIQEKMLSAPNLNAAEYPEIRFVSASAVSGGGVLTLSGAMTIRGKSQNVKAPLRYTQKADGYRFQGEIEIRQSDFGIRPESVGGLVKVADKVAILLDLVVRPTSAACRP